MITIKQLSENAVSVGIFDVIESADASLLSYAIDSLFDECPNIELHLATPGGDLDAAFRMRNAMSKAPSCTIHTEGTVASAGTILLCTDNAHVVAHKGSVFMIHMSASAAYANAEQLRKYAEMLDKYDDEIANVLGARMRCDEEELRNLLKDETWMSIDEAFKYGLIDEKCEEERVEESSAESVPVLESEPAEKQEPADFILERVNDEIKTFAVDIMRNVSESMDKRNALISDQLEQLRVNAVAPKVVVADALKVQVVDLVRDIATDTAIHAVDNCVAQQLNATCEQLRTFRDEIMTDVRDLIDGRLSELYALTSRACEMEGVSFKKRNPAQDTFTLKYTK